MVSPNKRAINCFKYEPVPGTDALTGAGDVAYAFGDYEEAYSLDIMTMTQIIQEVTNYASREAAALVVARKEGEEESIRYFPPNAQFLHRFFNYATAGAISMLDTGLPHFFTWRRELKGGTNEFVFQNFGCFISALDLDIDLEPRS